MTQAKSTTTPPRTEDAAQTPLPVVVPAVDVFESDTGYLIRLDVPGPSIDDIEVSTEEGQLSVSARRKEGTRLEYRRLFRLADDVDLAAVAGELKNGVLSIRLPRSPATQPRRIEIASG